MSSMARLIDGGVGPAVEQRADEALGRAVGAWLVRACFEMTQPKFAAGDRVEG
jgi:hypothetical protein